MPRRDAALPFLDIAWSSRKMAVLFERDVLPAVFGRSAQVTLTRERAAYEPGERCALLYSVEFADQPGTSRLAVATTVRDHSLEAITRHPSPPASNGANGALRALWLAEHRCLIEFFPQDWGLPSLEQAVDPQVARGLIAAASDDDGAAMGAIDVHVLRYYPQKRCVIRYERTDAQGGPRSAIVGKVYPPKSIAGRVWQTMQALHPQGAQTGIVTPLPLRLVPELDLILMEALPGISIKRLLWKAKTAEQGRGVIDEVARALAAIHAFRLESDEVRSEPTDLRYLEAEAASLDVVAPEFARRVAALLDGVRRDPVAGGSPCFIHGDFAPSQLLVDGDTIAMLDFDRACLGDPAIDVGNLMAKLHKKAVTKGADHYRPLAERFLSAYQAQAPGRVDARRAHRFQAMSLIRMAVHDFRRAPHAYERHGADSTPERLLEEAGACLATA
jgi:tRNA A-37 threonylcarbamoyl transferase component Bud32